MAYTKILKYKGQDKVVTVSDEHKDLLDGFNWYVYKDRNTFYVARMSTAAEREAGASRKTIALHRVIINAPPGKQVDHIDGNGLNNQIENLRLVSNAQNIRNRRPQGGTSRYHGVCWCKRIKKWKGQIYFNNRRFYICLSHVEVECALLRDYVARILDPEHFTVNFEEVTNDTVGLEPPASMLARLEQFIKENAKIESDKHLALTS